MFSIRPLETGDIPALPAIHLASFPGGEDPETVRRGYQTLVPELVERQRLEAEHRAPSLVAEQEGVVVGFVLVDGRQVEFVDSMLWLATTSHLAVSKEARGGLAAIRLLREVMAGPQDLTYVNQSNPAARQVLRAAGFQQFPAYSLRWDRMLRPATSLASRIGRRLGLPISTVVDRSGRIETQLPPRVLQRWTPPLPEPSNHLSFGDLTIETVASVGPLLVADADLRPPFGNPAIVKAIWDRLDNDRPRTSKLRLSVRTHRGDVVGWFIVDIEPEGKAEVLQMVVRPEHQRPALVDLLHELRERGVVTVGGELPMSLIYDLEELGCAITSANSTTSVHSTRTGILEAFANGRVLLSHLEGEFLVNPPASADR